MSDTLKSCPFCGSRAEFYSVGLENEVVRCEKCGAQSKKFPEDEQQYGATIWNTRTDPPSVLPIAAPSLIDGLDHITQKKVKSLIESGLRLVGVVMINVDGRRAVVDMGKVTWLDAQTSATHQPDVSLNMVNGDMTIVDDLALLCRQLVRSLAKAAPGNDLATRAMDYLQRKGLQGSPFRGDGPVINYGTIQDSLQLVPKEPTEDMVIDGFEAVSDFHDTDEYKAMSGCRRAAESARVCYRVMLAAAPSPAKGE